MNEPKCKHIIAILLNSVVLYVINLLDTVHKEFKCEPFKPKNCFFEHNVSCCNNLVI